MNWKSRWSEQYADTDALNTTICKLKASVPTSGQVVPAVPISTISTRKMKLSVYCPGTADVKDRPMNTGIVESGGPDGCSCKIPTTRLPSQAKNR